MSEFISLDLPPLLTAIFSAIACAVLGNYLVLRRLSLMGDAISHSVLPGIVVAFLLTSSRGGLTVFVGAAVAGITSAILIELIRKFGRVETGASMGVIFSIFFASGVILIEQAAARSIDLDADCLLHGQLESIFWYPPTPFFTLHTLKLVPVEVISSFCTLLLVVIFVVSLYKELKITSFDPALATSLGFSSPLLYQLLMIFVACAVVASFKVVGSILVIAMIICPAAIARLYTDKLWVQLWLSAVFAILSTVSGYLLGAFGPQLFNYPHSVSTSGMMAVVLGALLATSVFIAPQYGLIAKALRRWRVAIDFRKEDIVALLYRSEELAGTKEGHLTSQELIHQALQPVVLNFTAIYLLEKDGAIHRHKGYLSLSEGGRSKGSQVVRSHRLWESFLVASLGLESDHVHTTAEQLEHFSREKLESEIAESGDLPSVDPHGRKIPSS